MAVTSVIACLVTSRPFDDLSCFSNMKLEVKLSSASMMMINSINFLCSAVVVQDTHGLHGTYKNSHGRGSDHGVWIRTPWKVSPWKLSEYSA